MKNDEVSESSLNQLNQILPDPDENSEEKPSVLKRKLSVLSHSVKSQYFYNFYKFC